MSAPASAPSMLVSTMPFTAAFGVELGEGGVDLGEGPLG